MADENKATPRENVRENGVHRPVVHLANGGYRPITEGYTPEIETRGYTPTVNEVALPTPPPGGTGAAGGAAGKGVGSDSAKKP